LQAVGRRQATAAGHASLMHIAAEAAHYELPPSCTIDT
jgi:hypothetical protein